MTYILLLTGSRELPVTITEGLFEVGRELTRIARGLGITPSDRVIVYHGGCPHRREGASVDMLGARWADVCGFEVRERKADWVNFPHDAGTRRNSHMVAEVVEKARMWGAYAVCIGIPIDSSTGSPDCMSKARGAGLEVVEVRRWLKQGGLF